MNWAARAGLIAVLAGGEPRVARADWTIDLVEEGRTATIASFRFDALGRPHVVFGGDQLYYAVRTGATWELETIDAAPSIGGSASLALDAAGVPHVSYTESLWGPAGIYHAERVGGSWVTEYVQPTVYPAPRGRGIAVDASGRVFVLSWRGDQTLTVPYREGGSWRFEQVDTGVGDPGAIVADPVGNVFAAYQTRAGMLRLATWDGTGWVTEGIAAGVDPDAGCAIAVPRAGRPLLAYRDAVSGALRLARWNGSGWVSEVVDATGTAVTPSLAVDSLDRPAVSYLDAATSTLRVARWTGAAWIATDVSAPGEALDGGTIDIGPADLLAVAHVDRKNGEVVLRTFDGTAWGRERIESTRSVIYSSFFDFDPAGNPVLAYSLDSHRAIWWARWDGSAWDRRPVPGSFNPLEYSGYSLHGMRVAADGNLLLLVTDRLTDDLRLGRFDGSAWSWETVVNAPYSQASLELDGQGQPVIVYADRSRNLLVCARWDGASWSSVDLPSAGPNPVGRHALAMAGASRPVVAYRFSGAGPDAVRLARWNGLSWDVETVSTLASWNQASGPIGLALDSADRAAVVFHTSTDVQVARQDGTAWVVDVLWAPVPTRPHQSYLSAMVFDPLDRLLVSSAEPAARRLELATFTGSGWTREVIESDIAVAWSTHSSLRLDAGGRPALAYIDHDDFALKLARPPVPRILRGTAPGALAPVAPAQLPWVDPEPVLGPGSPPLLFYQVEGSARIALTKTAVSVRLESF